MSLSLWNDPFFNDPLFEVRRMQRDMDRLWSSLSTPSFGESPVCQYWRPNVDIREMDNNIVIHAELPGLNRNDINIELKDNTLTISGEKKYEKKEENEKFHRMERSYGKFSRSFAVPLELKEDQIKACFNNGVLEVCFPRPQDLKTETKKITVS